MPKVQILTNPVERIELKSNFFVDYFNFFAEESGNIIETEPEHILSLVEKVLFQLENNSNIQKTQYIANHLSHSILKDVSFLRLFATYRNVKPLFKSYLAITNPDKNQLKQQRLAWLKAQIDFKRFLHDFHQELNEKMFETAMKEIVKMLGCEHNLTKHRLAFKKLTQIIVSELLMQGRTKYEIVSVFDRILTKSTGSFPFPKELHTIDDKQKYLASLDLQKQFGALVDYYKEDKTRRRIYLKVQGAALEKDATFSYVDIQFISAKNEEFQHVFKEVRKLEEYYCDQYFYGENYFIAVVDVATYAEIATSGFQDKLRRAVAFTELAIANKLSIDASKFLIKFKSQACDFQFSGPPDKYVISEKNITLINDNPHRFLAAFAGPASKKLFDNEDTFIDATLRNDLVGLWQYLENLYPNRADKIIEAVAATLLLNEKEHEQILLLNYLRIASVPWQFNFHKLGVDAGVYVSLHNSMKSKHNQFVKLVNYPFFNELNRMMNISYTGKRYQVANKHYVKLLTELYENRNFVTHQNISNGRARQKLSDTIPLLVKRFRWILFDKIRTGQKLTMTQIIDQCKNEAGKLLSPQ